MRRVQGQKFAPYSLTWRVSSHHARQARDKGLVGKAAVLQQLCTAEALCQLDMPFAMVCVIVFHLDAMRGGTFLTNLCEHNSALPLDLLCSPCSAKHHGLLMWLACRSSYGCVCLWHTVVLRCAGAGSRL